jgi:hypothetical protein
LAGCWTCYSLNDWGKHAGIKFGSFAEGSASTRRMGARREIFARGKGGSASRVDPKIHFEEMRINLDAVVPCALILNELLSNCLNTLSATAGKVRSAPN